MYLTEPLTIETFAIEIFIGFERQLVVIDYNRNPKRSHVITVDQILFKKFQFTTITNCTGGDLFTTFICFNLCTLEHCMTLKS